jgi:hypothetical protein
MTNQMKNLTLIEYTPHMMGGDIESILNTNVSNFDELYDFIVNNIIKNNIQEWEDDLKYFYNVDTISEMKVHMLEGNLDSDIFVVWLAEEWQVICMTNQKYNELSHLNDYDKLDYIVNDMVPNIDAIVS